MIRLLTEKEKQIILTVAEFNIRLTSAARKLYVHRNTLIFQLDKIQVKTGLDPRNFYDLVKLVEMVGND